MIITITNINGRWISQIKNGEEVIFTSKPESRIGCAARVAINYMERTYGRPSTATFVMDIEEW